MRSRVVIFCGLGVIAVSGVWFMNWKFRRLNEQIKQKKRELQRLSDDLWKKRIFWLKMATACLGVGGVVYLCQKLDREIRIIVSGDDRIRKS